MDNLTLTKWSFLACGLGTLLFGLWWGFQRWNALANWPIVEGVVPKSDLNVSESSEGATMYKNQVTFKFTVQSREYEILSKEWGSSSFQERHQRIAQEYAVGTHHELRYNPSDSSQIQIGAGFTLEYFKVSLFCLLLGGFFAGVGGLLFFVSAKRR